MMFVCPLPIPWHETYQRLEAAWEERGRRGSPPPVPLILSGWVYSNDVAKACRWSDTLSWAESHGFSDLIPKFANEQKYMVAEMSCYDVGPRGGPMYLPWNRDEKERRTEGALKSAFVKLEKDWAMIAGEKLAAVTRPMGFTGRKKRRLLVKADPSVKPPWGEWDRLAPDERRRAFTRLRKASNDTIAPLMVDHIDFDTAK